MTSARRASRLRLCVAVLVALGLAAAGCGPNPTPVSHSGLAAALASHVPTQAASSGERRSVVYTVAFYLPNRIVDILDIVSFGIGIPSVPYLFPSTVHANAHVTRGFQAGLGSTHGMFLGKSWARDFAWGLYHTEFSVGPLTVAEMKHTTKTSAAVDRVGMLFPSDPPFAERGDQRRLDYWAIGAHAGVLPVAVSADVHPAELLDALLGFFFIDLLDDDYLGVRRAPAPPPIPAAPAGAPAAP